MLSSGHHAEGMSRHDGRDDVSSRALSRDAVTPAKAGAQSTVQQWLLLEKAKAPGPVWGSEREGAEVQLRSGRERR